MFLGLSKEKTTQRVLQLRPDQIVTNPDQPRREFDEAALLSLAESIAQNGLLQPVSVRQVEEGYELIAGERRLRACVLAGLETVPCLLFDLSSRASAVLALVENIQRQNLSFFEEAAAMDKLIDCYGLTQEDAAVRLGKAQSTVANKLRLLRISEEQRELIVKFSLTERHARALLKVPTDAERLEVLEHVIKHNLNVERTEQYIATRRDKEKERASYHLRRNVFRNVQVFVNTLDKAVATMKAAGIPADARKIQHDDYIEYFVRIPRAH